MIHLLKIVHARHLEKKASQKTQQIILHSESFKITIGENSTPVVFALEDCDQIDRMP